MLSFRKTEKGKAIEEISSKGGKRALILWNFCKMSKQLPLVNVRTCNSGFAANFLFYLCSLWKVSFIIFFHEGVTRLLSPIRILLFLPSPSISYETVLVLETDLVKKILIKRTSKRLWSCCFFFISYRQWCCYEAKCNCPFICSEKKTEFMGLCRCNDSTTATTAFFSRNYYYF